MRVAQALVVASLLLLAGCTSFGPSTDIRAKFGSAEKVPPQYAKVVVGVQLATTPKIMDDFLGRGVYAFSIYTLSFARVDPEARVVLGKEPQLRIAYHNTACMLSTPACFPYDKTLYQVVAVPAGSYAIESYAVERLGGAPHHRTQFFKLQPVSGISIGGIERRQIVPESSFYYWTLEPGETAYIGDFVLDHAYFPVRFNAYRRDDAAALAAARGNGVALDGTMRRVSLQRSRGTRAAGESGQGELLLEPTKEK
jgi:hypothetical protein